MFDWIIDNPDYRKPDFEIPVEVEVEMVSLRALLNFYFPNDYPIDGKSVNDEDIV